MFQKRIDAIREELAGIEKEIEDTNLSVQESKKPPRHGLPWTTFEKDTAASAFNQLVSDLAMKLGRTRLSLILHINSYIGRGMYNG